MAGPGTHAFSAGLDHQLARIASCLPGAVFSHKFRPDGSSCIPFATPAIEELLGISAAVLHEDASPFCARIHPEDRAHVESALSEAARELAPWHDLYRYLHPARGTRWIEGWSVPRQEPDGSIVWDGFAMDVTGREEAREALARREAQYRAVIEASTDGFWVHDGEGRILEVNDAYLRRSGYTREEILSMRISEVEAKEDQEEIEAHMARVMRYGSDLFESRHRARSGDLWPVEVNSSFLPIEGGRFYVFLRDIGPRKRSEALLRTRLWLSDAAPRTRLEEMIGFVLRTATLETGSAASGFRLREEGEGRSGPVAPEAEIRPAPTHAGSLSLPLQDDGRAVGILTLERSSPYTPEEIEFVRELAEMTTDAVTRCRAGSSIREAADRYMALVETSPDAIFVSRNDGVVLANQACLRLFGAARTEDLLGKSFSDLVAPEFHDVVAERIRRQQRGESLPLVEERIVRVDGTRVEVEVVSAPFSDGEGPAIHVVMRDITARKTAEAALQASERRFRSYIENSPVAVFVATAEGAYLDANQAGLEMVGYDLDALRRKHISEILLDEDPETLERDTVLLRRDQHFEAERRALTSDGRVIWVGMHAVPLDDGRVLAFCQDVTERRKIEEALRESEERYRGLVETSYDWIWEVDAEGRYTYVSPQVTELLGYAAEEVLGRTPFDFMPEPERQRVGAIFAGMQVMRSPFALLENVNLHRDGSEVVLETNGVPVFAPDGSFRGYRGTDRDVTARRASEIALRQSETTERLARQRLETLYGIGQAINSNLDAESILDRLTEEAMRAARATHGAALVPDTEGGVLRRRCLRGFTEEERSRAGDLPLRDGPQGRAYLEREPLYLPELDARARGTLLPGTRSLLVLPIVHGSEVLALVELQSPAEAAFSDRDSEFLHALGDQVAVALANARYTANLEERVEQRTAWIRREHTRTQAILDALGEGVVVTDLTGTIEYVNEAMRGITGFRTEECIGRNPRIWRSPGTPAGVYEEMWKTILGGRTWRGELVNQRRNGEIYDAAVTIAPIANADDPTGVVGFSAAVRDVSLQKRAEADIRRALEHEKELSELKTRFISMTSHEFRTPLSTILSSCELLEHYSGRWTDEKKTVHFRRIQAAVRNMTRLLEDVLTLGRAEAGRLEFSPAPLNLSELCHDLMEEMQLGAGDRHTLRVLCEGECPAAQVDERLVRQILANLVSNAIKYSPAGGPVELRLRREEDQAVFEVRDTGIGIPPEAQPRLYETFHRARNVGTIPGTGLGMSIARKAVDLHGGTINVTSELGRGTTVTVRLPIDPAGRLAA